MLAYDGSNAFRGLIAPASLKHSAVVGGADWWSSFPGFNRPGLIEAGDDQGIVTMDIALSGV